MRPTMPWHPAAFARDPQVVACIAKLLSLRSGAEADLRAGGIATRAERQQLVAAIKDATAMLGRVAKSHPAEFQAAVQQQQRAPLSAE